MVECAPSGCIDFFRQDCFQRVSVPLQDHHRISYYLLREYKNKAVVMLICFVLNVYKDNFITEYMIWELLSGDHLLA